MTVTQQASYTQTPTPTLWAAPAVTPTNELLFPNPLDPKSNDLYLSMNVDYDSAEVLFSIYTSAFRLVKRVDLGILYQGPHVEKIDKSYLAGLSNGVYFCIVETRAPGKTGRLTPQKLLILK
jgi:hypothetical protein